MSTEGFSKNTLYAIVITAIIAGSIVGVVVWQVGTSPEGDSLEIAHWWTSGGEKAAIDALVAVYTGAYPDTIVSQRAISGGSGTAFLPTLKSLAISGDLPDAFQLHAGYEAQDFVDAKIMESLDDIWASENLEAVIPAVVQDICQFDGVYYQVPVNIHRNNVVWYSTKLLADNGIDASTLTNWTTFFAACDDLKANGTDYPIMLGEAWTAAHTFEQIYASRGMTAFEKLINGGVTSATDTDLVGALNTFKTYLGYCNPDSSTLTWDAATAKIIANESAFNIMGDWANGEFYVADYVYDEQYGTFNVPGTGSAYSVTIDTFMIPKSAPHMENAKNWAKTVVSKAGQDAFNPIKGSIPARTDTNKSKYSAYGQSAMADFAAATIMYPAIVHGSAAPEAFKVEFGDIISAFVADGDVTAAAEAIAALSAETTWTKTWSLD